MSAVQKIDERETHKACADMLIFMADFSTLINSHINAVRSLLLSTVDQAMSGVMAINNAVDVNLRKSEELLVLDRETRGFVQKSAKEFDPKLSDSVARLKQVNITFSDHMAELSRLDESVRAFLNAIMGGLSVDDVVRQRLEHVSTSLGAMNFGVRKVLIEFSSGRKITDDFLEAVQFEMMSKMFMAFTMEDEKKQFGKVFGLIEGINQKSS